ncbi:ABC transporter permease [Subtercola frigoramans]|uniref:ABC-type nitrate/sulfonate/bicarbonate transport system permease component n=1 Tax=Subtercola frigoramans TaxID=120298 RepID=A0ABS2L2T3_9MICO|nr:ABC transporter permease [Subtercola frigoramans]MBM7470791.1 ABC-type nitrate/sulfonate/bicarbonate transport system permease component [Subtercola frigoramans]
MTLTAPYDAASATPPAVDRPQRDRPPGASFGSGPVMRVVLPVAAVIVLLAIWQVATGSTNLDPTVLPSPIRIATSGWAAREAIGTATLATLQITIFGLLFAVAAAMLVASVLAFVAPLRQTVLPLLIAAQSVPIIVLAPLVVIWFGFEAAPKVGLVAIVSMLPLTIATLQGLLSADPDADALMRSMGASPWKVFLRLRIPTALPAAITGLRITTSFIVVAAIFSEYVGARAGLGIFMQTQKNLYRTDLVFAAVFVSIVIGLALFALTYLLEWALLPWERRRKAAQR